MPPIKGKKYPKMSERQNRLWNDKNYRKKMIEVHKGQTPVNIESLIAFQKSEKGRAIVSKRFKGKTSPKKGMKSDIRGEKHYRWIKDRTKIIEKNRLRGTIEWKNWRKRVFERDKYTCQECDTNGVYIEPHHIIPVRSNMNLIFKINNGITLCRPCHQKTIWKESNFSEKYSAIVATQM